MTRASLARQEDLQWLATPHGRAYVEWSDRAERWVEGVSVLQEKWEEAWDAVPEVANHRGRGAELMQASKAKLARLRDDAAEPLDAGRFSPPVWQAAVAGVVPPLILTNFVRWDRAMIPGVFILLAVVWLISAGVAHLLLRRRRALTAKEAQRESLQARRREIEAEHESQGATLEAAALDLQSRYGIVAEGPNVHAPLLFSDESNAAIARVIDMLRDGVKMRPTPRQLPQPPLIRFVKEASVWPDSVKADLKRIKRLVESDD